MREGFSYETAVYNPWRKIALVLDQPNFDGSGEAGEAGGKELDFLTINPARVALADY